MANYVEDMKALAVQNKTFAVLGNGSWAPQSAKLMEASLSELKNVRLLTENTAIKSSLKEGQLETLKDLAERIAGEIRGTVL